MSWQDRVQKTILLRSPEGNNFEAKWIGNERSKEKSLGLFKYPKVAGTVVQDLEVNATSYPLTIYFDGPDNDIESSRFFDACSQSGLWLISHPTLGNIELQLQSVTEAIQPVTSGNVTRIELSFIEPLDPAVIGTSTQLSSTIEAQKNNVNEKASEQFDANIFQESVTAIKSVANAVSQITSFVKTSLEPLYKLNASIDSAVNSIFRSLSQLQTTTTIVPASIAGQVTNLIQLPLLATTDIESRNNAYVDLVDQLIALEVPETTEADKNYISTIELALTACISSFSLIVSTGSLQTRTQAINAALLINSQFNSITDYLDLSQEAFEDNDIDMQYFSQSSSYSDALKMNAYGIRYLLTALFDLLVEKTFVIKTPRAPIEVCITEYGDLGLNDSNFDLFISSNKLKKSEFMILRPGREIVIYLGAGS